MKSRSARRSGVAFRDRFPRPGEDLKSLPLCSELPYLVP